LEGVETIGIRGKRGKREEKGDIIAVVTMLVDAISQMGLSLERNERRRMNTRNELSNPELTALRVAFFDQ